MKTSTKRDIIGPLVGKHKIEKENEIKKNIDNRLKVYLHKLSFQNLESQCKENGKSILHEYHNK